MAMSSNNYNLKQLITFKILLLPMGCYDVYMHNVYISISLKVFLRIII